MTLSQKVQEILQEVAILGTGNAVNSTAISELEKYVGPDDDFSPLVDLVNSYMTNRAVVEGGTAQLLKIAAHDALGLTLSNEEADAIAAQLDSGQITWADIFAQVITSTEVLGQTLHNRSEAAQSFLAGLESAGKSGYFDGAAVAVAVKNNLKGIGASLISLDNGKKAFADLAARLKANGIENSVVDGYVKDATVFVDANGDGVLNDGEWNGKTDASGNYVLPSGTAGGKIIAFGGTDIMTGKPFQGILTAPVGSTVVNPLTTLVQQLIEDGKADTVEGALVAVQKAFGLSETTVLLHYDPLAVLANANASAADKSEALQVQAIALQVSNVISQIGSAIDAGSNADKLSATSSVISALAAAVAAGDKVNLASADTLTNIVKTAAGNNNVKADKILDLAQDLAKITAASNAAAVSAKDIVELSKSATVAQDSAVNAIISGVTNNNLGGAVNNFTGGQLISKINQAIPQDLTPIVPIIVTPPNNGGSGGSGNGGNNKNKDHDAPFLEFTTPSYGQILVADGEFRMIFNEPVKAGKGDISIVIGNGTETRIINVNDNQVFFDGNSVIIKPQNAWVADTVYQINLASGVITDVAENAFAGCNIRFTAIPSNPVLSWSNPGDGAADFQADSLAIILDFNEPVKAGSGNIRIVNDTDSGDTRTIPVNYQDLVTFVHNKFGKHGDLTSYVLIDPGNDLVANNDYHIEIDDGAITDLAGNAYAGISDPTTLNFTTIAPAYPVLSSSDPLDDAADFKVDSDITLVFNEYVYSSGSGAIRIVNDDNPDDTRLIDIDDQNQVTFVDNKQGGSMGYVVINPADDLVPNAHYHIEIENGAINDLTGHGYVGISDSTKLNFTTIAATGPIFTWSNPVDEATDFQVDSDITLSFNKPVTAVNGYIRIVDDTHSNNNNSGDTRTIAVTDTSQVIFNGYQVVINPADDLVPNAHYHIEIENGAINDRGGNAYAGISDPSALNFTTISSNPILNPWSYPENNAKDFQVDSDIRLDFNENVKPGSGNIVISNGSDTRTIAVTDASQVTFIGNQVFINPSTDLVPETDYHIEIANTAITDLAGNAYAGISDATALNFTTIPSNPRLSASDPQDEATDFLVDSNITLNFNEPVKAVSGYIHIVDDTPINNLNTNLNVGNSNKSNNSSDTRTISLTDTSQVTFARDKNGSLTGQVFINPTTDLIANTSYHIEIDDGAITDLAGNPYAGISDLTTLNFKAIIPDTTPPTATFSPADGATEVAVDDDIVLTFNEAVQAADGGYILISNDDNKNDTRYIGLNDASQVTISGERVIINPASDLAPESNYHIEITNTAIADLAGNPYAGISDSTTLNFRTISSDPYLLASDPRDDGYLFQRDFIQLLFNEVVKPGNDGFIWIVGDHSYDYRVISVTDSEQVRFEGDLVIIMPTVALRSDEPYHMEIDHGAITDLTGNPYAGISDSTTLNFTTLFF